jgi:hypothetical protein
MSVKPESTDASTAARPGSCCAPATAKKILTESTSKLPGQHDRIAEVRKALDESQQETHWRAPGARAAT